MRESQVRRGRRPSGKVSRLAGPSLGLQDGESASGGLDRGPSGEEKYDSLLISHLLQSRDYYCEPKEEAVLLK